MSNKITIKRQTQPPKNTKQEKTEGKLSKVRSRLQLPSLIPAIAFIAITIWYFITNMK